MAKRLLSRSGPGAFIVVLVAVYVVKQLFLVAAFYPFSGHDELAHFSYVRTLATEARIPVLPELHAWRSGLDGGVAPPTDEIPADLYVYCRFTLDWYCEPEDPRWSEDPPRIVTVPGAGYFPSGYQYVANHPPLYYAFAAPIYKLTASLSPLWQHYILRALAIPFGVIAVLSAFYCSRVLFPGDAFLLVTVPTMVAFQSQISYEAAMVNNDIVAIAITSIIILGILVGLRDDFPPRLCLALGVALGLGLLAKGTTIAIIPVLGLALLWRSNWRDWRGFAVRGLAVSLPLVAIAAPWYAYLFRTYGDFNGLARVAELQYWNQPMGSFFDLSLDPSFFADRFNESWGEYGWRLIHFERPLLLAIAAPLVIGVFGLLIFLAQNLRTFRRGGGQSENLSPWQIKAIVVLIFAVALAYVAVVQFGTSFALAQARYYFPIVTSAALLVLLGWRTVIPSRHRPMAQGLIVGSLVLLNLYIMVAYVLPFTSTYGVAVYSWYWGG